MYPSNNRCLNSLVAENGGSDDSDECLVIMGFASASQREDPGGPAGCGPVVSWASHKERDSLRFSIKTEKKSKKISTGSVL